MFDPRKESSLGSIVCSFGSGGGSERGDILGRHDDECKKKMRILMGFVFAEAGLSKLWGMRRMVGDVG